MPRSRSTAIQSKRTRRRPPRALTSPASWIAPPNSSSFSVKVVLPASGCEMIAKGRRRAISSVRYSSIALAVPGIRAGARKLLGYAGTGDGCAGWAALGQALLSGGVHGRATIHPTTITC
jgi:hypothetical protein